MEDLAGEVDRGLGAVVGLVEAELGADLEGLLEMPRQALELALDIVAQGRCHLDLMAVDIDTHSPPPGFSGGSCRCPQHRPKGACQGSKQVKVRKNVVAGKRVEARVYHGGHRN